MNDRFFWGVVFGLIAAIGVVTSPLSPFLNALIVSGVYFLIRASAGDSL